MDHFELLSDHSARHRVLAPDLEPDVNCAAAADDVPVLISADADLSEWLARLIHDRSARRGEPFIVFRPGRGDELRLFMSLLNGAGPGRGTLLVADVNRAGRDVQQLLRLAIGAAGAERAPFRVVAATSTWLFNEVERGDFDDRLFYGLNKIHITVGAREQQADSQEVKERRGRGDAPPEIAMMDVAAFRRHRQLLRGGYTPLPLSLTAITHHG